MPEERGPLDDSQPRLAGAEPTASSSGEPAVGSGFSLATLEIERTAAREEAAVALSARGFVCVSQSKDEWVGELALPASTALVKATVRIPLTFPDALPSVFVDVAQLPRRMAHVEESGKVCVAPTTNVLLDSDRPAALVEEVLSRAANELGRGFSGTSDSEFEIELLAYWTPTDKATTISICSPEGAARTIVICSLSEGSAYLKSAMLVADSKEQAETWATHLAAKLGSCRPALLIPVVQSVPLPTYGGSSVLRDVAKVIETHTSPDAVRLFHRAIESADYPKTIIFSLPEAAPGGGRRLIGARINSPDSDLLKRAAHGFRPGRVPASRILRMVGGEAVDRLRLERPDHAFLTARGGAATQLATARVAVVGVGAVGSEVARNLASLGVGSLRLVDPENLALENVHRHALGVRFVGTNKANAMAADLTLGFPHLNIEFRPTDAEQVLKSEPRFLLDADIIILATGEETLERRLNRLLIDGPPRVHAWVEPLGLAGHAFACGNSAKERDTALPPRGCFDCLYKHDETYGILNQTALTAPGQEIRSSLAGCAGTFSPFSQLDARRTAIEAAQLAAQVVTGNATLPVLVTWRGSDTAFEREGFRLSKRAATIPPGGRVTTQWKEPEQLYCEMCGGAPSHGRATFALAERSP